MAALAKPQADRSGAGEKHQRRLLVILAGRMKTWCHVSSVSASTVATNWPRSSAGVPCWPLSPLGGEPSWVSPPLRPAEEGQRIDTEQPADDEDDDDRADADAAAPTAAAGMPIGMRPPPIRPRPPKPPPLSRRSSMLLLCRRPRHCIRVSSSRRSCSRRLVTNSHNGRMARLSSIYSRWRSIGEPQSALPTRDYSLTNPPLLTLWLSPTGGSPEGRSRFPSRRAGRR